MVYPEQEALGDPAISFSGTTKQTVIAANAEMLKYNYTSGVFENNDAVQTITYKVWICNRKPDPDVAPALTHDGAEGWGQVGTDIVLTPGDRLPYIWSTMGRFLAVTGVATGSIAGKGAVSIFGRKQ